MTDHPMPVHADDGIDLLDLLVTIAESWKLLVFGPLLIGAVTAVMTSLWPTQYQSTAILRLTEDEVAVLHSASVIDPLLQPFGYIEQADGVVEDAREALKKDLVSAADKRTKLVVITAKADTPSMAQQLNTQVISRLLDELAPKGQQKANIEQIIAIRQQTIALTEESFERLVQALHKGSVGASNVEQAVTNIAALIQLVQENKQEIQALQASLQVKGSEVFVQPPTLPQKAMPRKRARMSVVAALAAGFAVLLFVFIRKALVNAGANLESAVKLASIRRSLGLGH
ncbi:hypothetical protein MCEMIEM28_01627 [Burkholderiaceae bacterium]